MTAPRRVITGLDANGRSCILFDGPSDFTIWSAEGWPVDNTPTKDMGGATFGFPLKGASFIFHDFPPHSNIQMHATDSVDFIVFVSGEITFITETGEVHVRAGDVLVDRGILHGWRNDSDQPCRIMNVLLPAHPVGKGGTYAGTTTR